MFLFTTALIVCELVAAEAVVNDIVANDDNVITDNAIAIILLLMLLSFFFIIITTFLFRFSIRFLVVPYLVTTVYQGDCDKIRTKKQGF